MSAKQAKRLRNEVKGAVEEIVAELLPSIMAGQLFAKLQAENAKRLEVISEDVKRTLVGLDERSKAVQDYIVRAVETSKAPEAPKSETA